MLVLVSVLTIDLSHQVAIFRSYFVRRDNSNVATARSRIYKALHIHPRYSDLSPLRMSSGYHLPPPEHATFAVISRLLSCMVTESLLRAYYIPLPGIPNVSGFAVILSTHLISEQPIINRSLRPRDVFIIVPLQNPPAFGEGAHSRHGHLIGLLDPLDMFPAFYELTEHSPNPNYVRFLTSGYGLDTDVRCLHYLRRVTSRWLSLILYSHQPGNSVNVVVSLKLMILSTSGVNSWMA